MSVNSRLDDEDLDPYERWARDRLQPFLGLLRITDRKGWPPGLHDFEADLPEGLVAAIEVTSTVEQPRRRVEAQLRRLGQSSFPLPGLTSRWLVHVTDHADVRTLSRRRGGLLRPLLSELEAQRARHAHDMGDYRSPVVLQLRKLQIASVFRMTTGRGGGVLMGTDGYSGFAWYGPDIDTWLDEFLASGQGVNKLEKLGRAKATERHLVIVLERASQPGMGIPLGLSCRHDAGAAEYVMPSFEPPKPLTHLWLLPMVDDEGLRWTRGTGWAVLAALCRNTAGRYRNRCGSGRTRVHAGGL